MTTELDQQLMRAANSGDLDAVADALEKGASVGARGQFGDTALNEAAGQGHVAVVERLLEAGADLENKGGADMPPLMNAACAGHVDVVKLLLARDARVSNDLLSSIQLKVNILEENAEDGMVRPEAAEAWKGFLQYLITARIEQDLPQIVEELSAPTPERRLAALERAEAAAIRRIDVSAAAGRLAELASDPDPGARRLAVSAISKHYATRRNLEGLRGLFEGNDVVVKTGAVGALASAARDGADVASLVPTMLSLLGEGDLDLRHDAAIAVGYAATNKVDVSGAVPRLTERLSDAEPDARRIAAWALYRIAKHVGDVSAAVPALERLREDEDEGVREMAAEALAASKARQG